MKQALIKVSVAILTLFALGFSSGPSSKAKSLRQGVQKNKIRIVDAQRNELPLNQLNLEEIAEALSASHFKGKEIILRNKTLFYISIHPKFFDITIDNQAITGQTRVERGTLKILKEKHKMKQRSR